MKFVDVLYAINCFHKLSLRSYENKLNKQFLEIFSNSFIKLISIISLDNPI